MDHKAFIASLSNDERRKLTQKSDSAGLLQLAAHIGLITLGAIYVGFGGPFWPVVLVPLGIAIIFLFTLMHEAIHKTPFATVRINDLVAQICGLVLVLPAGWFRYFHLAHHRHTQDPEKDPELASSKPETFIAYAIHITGVPVWVSQIRTLFANAIFPNTHDYVPAGGKAKVRREARIMLALYATLIALSFTANSTILLWIWIVPAVLGQPFLRLYLLAEHGRCALAANMFENTRTTLTNRVVRFIAWNMPYHAEHHAYPSVPFHKLPDMHRQTRQHLAALSSGYTEFHRNYTSAFKQQSSG